MSKNNKYECIECGTSMVKADEEVLVCPACQHSVDIEDYGYENEYDDYYSSVSSELDDTPEGCSACGGPYPQCTSSCKLFNE